MNEKELLFLTGLFPKELEDEIIESSKGNVQNAANAVQWNLVEGLVNNFEGNLEVLNSMYIGSFPNSYNKLFIKSHTFEISENRESKNIGFINLILLKHYFRYWSLKKHLKTWALKQGDGKVVMAYAVTNVNLWSFKYIKKINPNIETCIIVPDLPEHMNTTNSKNHIYSFLKNISMKRIKEDTKYIDKCVYISEHMKTSFPGKPYMVMEGIATIPVVEEEVTQCNVNNKVIMYSGTLNERYGILNLVKAFQNITHKNYTLVICGDGDSKEKIIEASQKDTRIVYKGSLPRNEVLKLQKTATVLINPRMNNEEFCKYSFPSKILEYLSSGVPVIAYMLDGMGEEYANYIYTIEGNTINDLTDTLNFVCEKDETELKEKGREALNFVKLYKNKNVQCTKIINFLSN